MDYLNFLKNYASSKGCRFTQIDDNTYRMISKNGLLRVHFRIHINYLEAWGAFIELADKIDENELEQLLNDAFNNKKMVYGLDADLNFIKTDELDLNDKIDLMKHNSKIKYILEIGFFTDANFYEVKGKKLLKIELPKIDNVIGKIADLLRESKVEFEIRPYYLWESEDKGEIYVSHGETYLIITANFWGNTIRVEKKSSKLDFSVHDEKIFPLTKYTLEEIVDIIKSNW